MNNCCLGQFLQFPSDPHAPLSIQFDKCVRLASSIHQFLSMFKAIKQRRVSDDASPWLPEDMVGEILSWLPVKSLLRFKCVCKKWYQLIQQDDEFVEKHHRRAAICFYYHKKYINQPTRLRMGREWQIHTIRKDAEFSCIDIQKGLVLEQERRRKNPTERLRIKNPATRQTVYLPDLRVGNNNNKPPTWVVARMFFVVVGGNQCTVISFSESEESVLLGRFRALTVGVDAAWRPLKNKNSIHYYSISNHRWKTQIYALSIENIFHVVIMDRRDADGNKILSVNAEDESIKTAKIPENVFSSSSNGLFSVTPIQWNSKLALLCDEVHEFYIWVLMNHNNNQWAKTYIVDLATFIHDYRPILFITEEEKIWIRRRTNGKWWKVIWSPQSETVLLQWRIKDKLSIKPTVLQLTGMQSDKVEEAIGASFWKDNGDMPTTTSQIISSISLLLESL